MDFSIVFTNGIFEVKLSGKAASGDYVNFLDALVTHENWIPGSLVISDESQLEISHLKTEDVVRIANICGSKRTEIGKSKFAAITQSEVVFGKKRMWDVYVESEWEAETMVFKDRKEALEWLV